MHSNIEPVTERIVMHPASAPFAATGGLELVTGNIGRACVKISAVKPD